MFGVTVLIAAFGLVLAPLFTAGQNGALAMMIVGLALMGVTYGPLGTVVSGMFPTNVRYTGSSLAFEFCRDSRNLTSRRMRPPGWQRITACSMWGTT